MEAREVKRVLIDTAKTKTENQIKFYREQKRIMKLIEAEALNEGDRRHLINRLINISDKAFKELYGVDSVIKMKIILKM